MSDGLQSLDSERRNRLGKVLVLYDGFPVMEELVTRCRQQLAAIAALSAIQKQFIGTMVDTEVAVGYFFRNSKTFGGRWVAYLAVKMKYGGDLKYFAEIIGHGPPSRSYNANTITHSLDLRWSLQTQGIVAYTLVRDIREFLHNEKSIIEVDCIRKHGPIVSSYEPHPFIQFGGSRVRRGVWHWPSIDDTSDKNKMSIADK